MKAPITTHVLDTALGRPAAGVAAVLECEEAPGRWRELARGVTDADGRIADLLAPGASIAPGTYRMTFDTGSYFSASGVQGLYPSVIVVFAVADPKAHYHIPLLLSPYGYSTYRGS
jgi:5-hydroxyisourate hydrolase